MQNLLGAVRTLLTGSAPAAFVATSSTAAYHHANSDGNAALPGREDYALVARPHRGFTFAGNALRREDEDRDRPSRITDHQMRNEMATKPAVARIGNPARCKISADRGTLEHAIQRSLRNRVASEK